MNPLIIVALIGLVSVVSAAFISSKWTKKTVENKFLVTIQESYKKLIEDLELTNMRLRTQRDLDEKQIDSDRIKIETYNNQFDDLNRKMTIINQKLGIVEPQRCLLPNCTQRVYP